MGILDFIFGILVLVVVLILGIGIIVTKYGTTETNLNTEKLKKRGKK